MERLEKPNGFYAKDGMDWGDGTGFYAAGEKKFDVADSRKQFTSIGAYVILLPDKKWYNRLTGEFGDMEASWSGSAKIQDGTYAGESAEDVYKRQVRAGEHPVHRRGQLHLQGPGGGPQLRGEDHKAGGGALCPAVPVPRP